MTHQAEQDFICQIKPSNSFSHRNIQPITPNPNPVKSDKAIKADGWGRPGIPKLRLLWSNLSRQSNRNSFDWKNLEARPNRINNLEVAIPCGLKLSPMFS